MHWLESLDVAALRFINQTLSNPFFDFIMPIASSNRLFFPIVVLTGLLLIWKGGVRGRLCVLMLVLIVGPGDGVICKTLKEAANRPRPYVTIPDLNRPSQKLDEASLPRVAANSAYRTRHGNTSMPSSHAANWGAATIVLLVFFRRSWRIMVPLAVLVCFSRVYNGVHYPSDVLAGAILGAAYAGGGLWLLDGFWKWIGPRWFPAWSRRLPSLIFIGDRSRPDSVPAFETEPDHPAAGCSTGNREPPGALNDRQWLRLGYLLAGVLLLGRLLYISGSTIQLSEDEAYQWVWSKRPALSYYSKPPMIACTQRVGTLIWGDSAFGVRFFSPVLAALTSILLLRFLTPITGARGAFLMLLVVSTTPLLAAGSVLMTVDPLSVCFWVLAMIAGWRAVQPGGRTVDWVWVGVWTGLGFLSKYTALFQWLCWATFFVLWKPARMHLTRPGPWLAVAITALAAIPVLVWNHQHDWITVTHVAGNAQLHKPWKPGVVAFLAQEFVLLNPFFFVAMVWAAAGFWRRMPESALARYFFAMGAPLFLCYLAWSFRASIKPNWIAPAVIPLFCLTVLYWKDWWLTPRHWARQSLVAGCVIGGMLVMIAHDTDLISRVIGRNLPAKVDPLTRVRAWDRSAYAVGEMRRALEAETGRPVFIIAEHYGVASQLNFYLPEARAAVADRLLVYTLETDVPRNQYFFWPGYRDLRKGESALYVRELSAPPLVPRWYIPWLKGEPHPGLVSRPPRSRPPPPRLLEQFESVTDLGQVETIRRTRVMRTFQIFECRNLQ